MMLNTVLAICSRQKTVTQT